MHRRSLLLSVAVCIVVVVALCGDSAGQLYAGVARVNGTQVGLPLAGFNHGERRVPYWPLPIFTEYTTWMTPSKGFIDPTWVKTVVISTSNPPNPNSSWALMTLDGIGSDSSLNYLAYAKAVAMGFTVPLSNCIFSGSHSHSGPGAVSPETLWAIAPAVDIMVPKAQDFLATAMAKSMIQAQSSMVPAKMDLGMGELIGVTVNRRGGFSPFVQRTSIDPHLGVMRIESATGQLMATVWNFAIHGVCYGPSNLYFSGDIMGRACTVIEETDGGIALFVNGDAGDIDPAPGMCNNAPNFVGSNIMASAVVNVSRSLNPSNQVSITSVSQNVAFGWTNLNYTLQRFNNCSSGGTLDVCTLCAVLQCDLNAHMPASWLEDNPRFTAVRFDVNQKSTVLVTLPGEPLLELGWWVRNDTQDLGFDQTFLCGYSNSHMGYFATPDEYDIGGYESQLTFWGINTAAMIRNGSRSVSSQLKPENKHLLKPIHWIK